MLQPVRTEADRFDLLVKLEAIFPDIQETLDGLKVEFEKVTRQRLKALDLSFGEIDTHEVSFKFTVNQLPVVIKSAVEYVLDGYSSEDEPTPLLGLLTINKYAVAVQAEPGSEGIYIATIKVSGNFMPAWEHVQQDDVTLLLKALTEQFLKDGRGDSNISEVRSTSPKGSYWFKAAFERFMENFATRSDGTTMVELDESGDFYVIKFNPNDYSAISLNIMYAESLVAAAKSE